MLTVKKMDSGPSGMIMARKRSKSPTKIIRKMANGYSGMKTGRLRQKETILIIKNQENGQLGIPGDGDRRRLRMKRQRTLILFYGLRINKNHLKEII